MAYGERRNGKLTGRWVCDAEYKNTDGSVDRWHKAFASKQEAEGAEAYFRATGQKPPHLTTMPSNAFAEVCERFKRKHPEWFNGRTGETNTQRFEFALAHLGKLPVTAVRHKQLEEYVELLQQRCGRGGPPANRTVNGYLNVVSKVLRYALKLELIPGMPAIPRLTNTGKKRRPLTLAQEDALVAELVRQGREVPAFLVRVLAATGMRRGELFAIDAEQITVDRERPENTGILLRPEQTKTNEPRWVAISVPSAAEKLKVLVRQGLGDPLHLSHWIKSASKACGETPPFTTHCLRHTTVTRLIDAGVSDIKTAEFVGHSTGRVTQGYYHADKAALHEVAKLVQQRLGEMEPKGAVVPLRIPVKSTTYEDHKIATAS